MLGRLKPVAKRLSGGRRSCFRISRCVGASAVAVTAMLRHAVDARVTIALRGGELEIEWDASAPDAHVFMTGPAAEVFEGRIPWDEEG